MKQILSELTIEVTQRCPNNCLFCSSLACENSNHFISSDKVLSVGQQAVQLGLHTICISGGEPLCHPDILEIVNGLAKKNLNVAFYTTGLIIGINKKVIAFNDWCVFRKANPTLIFNIQSTNPLIHDKLAGRQGAFILTRNSILHAQEKGFHVEVHIVPNRLNLSSLESTVLDLSDWGIKRISFLRLVYQGYARDNISTLYLDAEELKELEKTFEKISVNGNGNTIIRFGIPFSCMVNKPQHCNAGQIKLIIRYDGKVFPCEAFKDSMNHEFIIGDIYHDNLSTLLNKGNNLEILNLLKEKTNSSEPCPAQLLYA